MKKLTNEEYNKLLVTSGRGGKHPILTEVMKLEIGESIFIAKEEWNKKTPITTYVANYKLRIGMNLSIRKVEGGFAIKRKS